MDIVLNGDTLDVPDGQNVHALLEAHGLGDRRVAVEVNGTIVPRAQHPLQVLVAGDRIEIVHALGGG